MPRCNNCKQKFQSTKFNAKYCDEIDCKVADGLSRLEAIKKQNKKKWSKDKAVLKESLKTKQDYEKELEAIFNTFIRERDKDKPCISCQAPAGTYKITCGHFHPAGTYKNIRFHEDNSQGQCWWNCNKNKHGNLSEYRPRLIERIGQERVDELDRLRNIPRHYTILELIELKVKYKDKIKSLKP